MTHPSSTHGFLTQPEEVLALQPDRQGIEARGQTALQRIVARRDHTRSAAAGQAWAERRELAALAVLRAHATLGELNNLLLPPLFTLIILDLVQGGLPGVMQGEVQLANALFCSSFATEWGLGLWLARSRRAYLANAWLLTDLVSSLPLSAMFQTLRLTRFGRLLRFAKVLKLLRGRRFQFPVGRLLRAVGIAASVSVAGAFALEAVEPDSVNGLADALWWSSVTVTTVGYGDIAPITGVGRVIAGLLMLTGVGVFSYLAGLMAAVVFDPEEDAILGSVVRLEDKLDAVLERLDRLEQRP